MKRQKWEYLVANVLTDERYCSVDSECLDKLGKDGWELVDATDKKEVIFKRPVIEEDKP